MLRCQSDYQDSAVSRAAESGRRFYNRHRRSNYRSEYEKISKDLAVRTYLADLSKTSKPTSENSKKGTLLACRKFLEQTKRPITESAMQELVQFKRDNPGNTTIEQELKLWKAEADSTSTQVYIAMILGLFRRNYARLDLTIHVEGSGNKAIPFWRRMISDRDTIRDAFQATCKKCKKENTYMMSEVRPLHLEPTSTK